MSAPVPPTILVSPFAMALVLKVIEFAPLAVFRTSKEDIFANAASVSICESVVSARVSIPEPPAIVAALDTSVDPEKLKRSFPLPESNESAPPLPFMLRLVVYAEALSVSAPAPPTIVKIPAD